MAACPVKCIINCYSRCQSKGSIIKRLVKFELKSAHANESRLASKWLLDERQLTLDDLRRERDELTHNKADLLRELQTLKRSITWLSNESRMEEITDPRSSVIPRESVRENATIEMIPLGRIKMERTETVESEDSESEEARPKIGHPRLPGFRELRE